MQVKTKSKSVFERLVCKGALIQSFIVHFSVRFVHFLEHFHHNLT